MGRLKIADSELAELYATGTKINDIALTAGVSRQAIFAALKRIGVHDPLRGSIECICAFCGERFRKYRKNLKTENYCSPQCFHSDRSIAGRYSQIGVSLSETVAMNSRKLGHIARKAVKESGIELKPGQVVHHINGDRTDNRIENLQVFDSHTEHMKLHHDIRKNKYKQ